MKGDLSANFSRKEWACKCGCGFDTVDAELVKILQEYRDEAKAIVIITPHGGCRCPIQNKASGGAIGSQHMKGKAADIHVKGKTPKEVFDYFDKKYPVKYGVGLYKTFTHIDVRNGLAARW